MKIFRYIPAIILTLVLLTGPATRGQKKYDKMVDKVKEAYEKGDYNMAAKYNNKLKKKVTKKLGTGNAYMVEYNLMAARNALALGMLFVFEDYLTRTIELSSQVNSDRSVEHARILNEAASLLLQNENPKRASGYIDQARDIIASINDQELTRDIEAFTNLNAADVYATRGYYARAIEFISESEDYYAGRATTRVTIVDAKSGKLKTVKLSPREIAQRMDDYARLMNLKARTYSKMGDFIKADETFLFAADWIDDNLGKGNIRYVQNLLWQGQMLEENGAAPKVTRKIYEDALANLKKKHLESHYLAIRIYEALLNSYLRNNELARFKNLSSEYERVIKKYFKKQSVIYVHLDALKFRYQLALDKTGKVVAKVNELLGRSNHIPEFHATRIRLMEFGYRAALQAREYETARQFLEQILTQKKELYGEESPEYHLTVTEVANYYIDFTDKLKEAGRIYEESFSGIVKPQITQGHASYVRTLNHLAKYYEITDQLEAASATLEEALKATRIKYDDEDINYAIELQKIAALQIKIGDYKKANENIEKAIDILHKERRDRYNAVYYVMALETKARLLALEGFFTEARNLLNRSQKFLYRAEDLTQYDELASAIDLAEIKIKLGRRISETEELLTTSLQAYEDLFGPSSYHLIAPLLSYGDLRLFTGDYAEAEKIARRAQQIATEKLGPNSSKAALAKILLARIYTNLGDYEKAKQLFEEVLAIQEKVYGRQHIAVARTLSGLGLVMFYKEDDPRATEKVFDEAKNIIAEKLGNRTPLYAELMKNLSLLYIQQNRFNDAFTSLSIAKSIWEERLSGKGNVSLAGIYSLTGDLYYQQKDYEKAEENYIKSRSMYDYFFNPDHPDYVRVLSKLSKVYYMQGDRRKAKKAIEQVIDKYDQFIKEYFPALSEREKAKFWNTIKTDYEYYVSVAMVFRNEDPRMIEKVYNNALLTKAILLSSSIKIRQRIMNGDDEELKKLYNEWLEKKELLTTALSMSTEQLIENEIDPIVIQEEVELLEKELSARSELIKASHEQKRVTWQDVQKVLKPNEVAIEFIRYRHFDHIFTDSVIYAGLYLKHRGKAPKPQVFTLNNGYDLENKYFKAYKNSIIFRIRDRYSYPNFWEPIARVAGDYSTIYLSPDGVFNQINLEAIPIDKDTYVLDVANIILVSNTKDIYLHSLRKQAAQEKIAASMFGNPIYYLEADAPRRRRISQLVGTEKEIEELKKLLAAKGWDTEARLEVEATERAVKTVESPDILHIATHGFFTPAEEIKQDALSDQIETKLAANPLLRTGLLFAGAGDLLAKTQFNYNLEDGILTAYEAMSMNLDKTELVVLSACETGLGDLTVGEGVYGLQRAFMVAGAKTLIMSMFKVDDTATQKLMISFYKKWLETGKKRESFVAAKKELRQEYKDPIFWGAFIMIGLE